jgi:hypothetical protein
MSDIHSIHIYRIPQLTHLDTNLWILRKLLWYYQICVYHIYVSVGKHGSTVRIMRELEILLCLVSMIGLVEWLVSMYVVVATHLWHCLRFDIKKRSQCPYFYSLESSTGSHARWCQIAVRWSRIIGEQRMFTLRGYVRSPSISASPFEATRAQSNKCSLEIARIRYSRH